MPNPHSPALYTWTRSDPRSRTSNRVSSVWWQVKDSNLRSFRDGFTDRSGRASDLQKHRHVRDQDTNRPQTLDVSRSPPAIAGQPNYWSVQSNRGLPATVASELLHTGAHCGRDPHRPVKGH